MSKEAMKLALEALENSIDLVSNEARNAEELYGKYPSRLPRIQGLVAFEVAHEKAITALRAALEQPAQQQAQIVRWNCPCGNKYTFHGFTEAPAQRTWVGLTDEELSEVYNQADWDTVNGWEYERAIEAKLKEKNNG